MNRRLLPTIIAIVIFGAIAYGLMNYFASQKDEVKPPVVENQDPFVKTKVVSYSNAKVDVVETGRLIAKGRVDLITEVNGKILEGDVPLILGQSFKKGEVLLHIYDEDAKLSLRAAKSRFLSSIANVLPDLKYDYADNYDNWLSFFNSIKIDENIPDLPQVKSENEKIYLASKNILNDFYSIKSSEIILSRYTVKAPFDGSYSSVSMEVGAIANMGSRVAKMIRTDVLELQVPISMEEVPYVKKGQSVEVDYKGKTIKGKVDRVSDFVDPNSQSILVYVEMKNSKEMPLYEGMFMKAKFAETELKNVIQVPRQAVFNFDEVFVVENNKLQKRRVGLAKVDEYTAYISGLKEGELIVIESLINARDQMPVIIKR